MLQRLSDSEPLLIYTEESTVYFQLTMKRNFISYVIYGIVPCNFGFLVFLTALACVSAGWGCVCDILV